MSANSVALKRFFRDFSHYVGTKGAKKKILNATGKFFRDGRHHISVPKDFTEQFIKDLRAREPLDRYLRYIAEAIWEQLAPSSIAPYFQQKEDEEIDTKVKLKEKLNGLGDLLKSAEPPIPPDKQLYILTVYLVAHLGDQYFNDFWELAKNSSDNIQNFIDAVCNIVFLPNDIPEEEPDSETQKETAKLIEKFLENPSDSSWLTFKNDKDENTKNETAKQTENEQKPAEQSSSSTEANQFNETDSSGADDSQKKEETAPEANGKQPSETITESSANPATSEQSLRSDEFHSNYPLEGEEDESDPEQTEGSEIQRRYDSAYLTGQLKKNGKYWVFFPLYEWVAGSPTYIKDVRSRFAPYGSITIANMDAHYSSNTNKLLRGGLYNIEITDSDLHFAQDRCEVSGPSLFREKKIWRSDLDETDDGYRRAYYVVEPVLEDELWSIEDRSIAVTLAGQQTLPEEIADLFNIGVLLNIGSSFIGPLQLIKNGKGQLTVNPHSSNSIEYVYDSYGSNGEHLWPMDAIRFDKPMDAVFTYPLFNTHRQIDLISDEKLLKLVSKEIPLKKEDMEKVESWIHELPSFKGKNSFELSPERIQRIKHIFAENKKAANVLFSMAPSITKLLESDFEGKDQFVDEVAKTISANQDALALLQPNPAYQSGVKKLEEQKARLKSDIQALKDSYKDEKYQLELEQQRTEGALQVKQQKAKIDNLQNEIKTLQAERTKVEDQLNERKAFLADAESQLDSFEKRLNLTVDKVASLAFEGSLTAKIMEAAEHWRTEKDHTTYKARVQALRSLPKNTDSGKELNDYLCRTLHKIRSYPKNEFVNLFVCLAQSFLTVLAGSPGSGKTSLCNYVARMFGLTSIKDQEGIADLWPEHPNYANRYIPVSVERGWTSKRDLIGYFNPLSRTFESVDPHRFECFKQLDYEAKEHFEELPYFLLLDEANLSPMEYYFADFMNICDVRNDLSFVSIGGHSRYQIPDSLRFLATINNDHTTEMLSPRLVDRTWIIQLPETDKLDASAQDTDKALEKCGIIDWNLFRKTYTSKQKNNAQVTKDLKKISAVLSPLGLILSPRTRTAIANYVGSAQEFMELENTARPPYRVALDFAVAQKILPMINGSGEAYRKSLDSLKDFLAKEHLSKSASALDLVISKGTDAMDFYRFF